ncbi:hypothetical protein B0H34DRAFT_706258 [Crassisporium funariophilum]|nr:hypothetical protein B0H34DRAFT_706258 [Crassisporium funariophilum]
MYNFKSITSASHSTSNLDYRGLSLPNYTTTLVTSGDCRIGGPLSRAKPCIVSVTKKQRVLLYTESHAKAPAILLLNPTSADHFQLSTYRMATLDYIDIPPGASRLRSDSKPKRTPSLSIRPAAKIITCLPHPSPPPSPTTSTTNRKHSFATALASPTLNLIPQLLLAGSLPPSSPTPSSGTADSLDARRKLDSQQQGAKLLSAKDPLSIPIMTVNFKRFVSIVGPVFWVQDRVEEILFWKRGWGRTGVWMACYAFLCFYPRLILLLPHIALIAIILSTYPYPPTSTDDPVIDDAGAAAPGKAAAEGSVPWQANIQGIQNLMGAAADLHALIEPLTYHLYLHPTHLSAPPPVNPTLLRSSTNSSSDSSSASSKPAQTAPPTHPTRPPSPYTPHILTLLTLTLPPLIFLVSLTSFPMRAVCLVGGLTPVVALNPVMRRLTSMLLEWSGEVDFGGAVKDAVAIGRGRVVRCLGCVGQGRWFGAEEEKENKEGGENAERERIPLGMLLRRVIDDDRLSDECWNAEMREVELWENERFGGPTHLLLDRSSHLTTSFSSSSSSGGGSGVTAPVRGWSKLNLRIGERGGWTRGRDGWTSVGGGGAGAVAGAVEGDRGEVSSNLTFSLAPGWAFVESEDWRKDLGCAWSGCGGDSDGWVYTNDAWLGSRQAPYTAGGGSITRRRRWVRRVWFSPEREGRDS